MAVLVPARLLFSLSSKDRQKQSSVSSVMMTYIWMLSVPRSSAKGEGRGEGMAKRGLLVDWYRAEVSKFSKMDQLSHCINHPLGCGTLQCKARRRALQLPALRIPSATRGPYQSNANKVAMHL